MIGRKIKNREKLPKIKNKKTKKQKNTEMKYPIQTLFYGPNREQTMAQK